MKKQFLWILYVGVFLSGSLVLTIYRGQSQVDTTKNLRRQVDFTRFPIVDYASPAPGDAAARAKRAAKGKKYNTRYLPVISEYDVTFVVNESLVGLPALPVDRSSVVLVGEIIMPKPIYLTTGQQYTLNLKFGFR